MVTDTPRPLVEHLDELRNRLFRVFGAWALGFCVAVAFKEVVWEFLMHPAIAQIDAHGFKLSALEPAEEFFTYLKAAFLAGFLVTLPVTLYQAWAFVSPGLYSNERRLVLPFVIATTGLFAIGNTFGYLVAFPFVFDFFLSLENPYVVPQWSMKAVFGFLSRLYIAFGVAFQLPIIMFFLAAAGIVRPDQMASFRRYAIVAMFVVAALITPPDVISQIMLAIPLMVLYESGVLASRLAARRRSAAPSEEPST